MIETMGKLLKTLYTALVAVLLCSCGKETVTNNSPESSAHRDPLVCAHTGLVHHPAVEATFDARGNVEYWSCPQCGIRFSDAQGKDEYTGRIYVLPKKFIEPSCLAGYHPFSERAETKDGITAGAIASIAELLVTISSLAVTCVSYCDDCEDVIDEINEVKNKEAKNADDMAVMDNCLSLISSNVRSYNNEMDRMQVMVDEMILNVNEADEILKKTRETLVNSLSEVSKLEDNIRIYNLFDTRYKDILSLDSSTSQAWTAINDLLHKGSDLLSSAVTAIDSADVLITKTHQLENIVSAWGTDKSYPDKTAALLSRYLQMDADYGSTFVKLLDDYSAEHFVWDHQAIPFRKMVMDYDFTVLSQAYALTSIYYGIIPSEDNRYRRHRLESMEKDFNAMLELAEEKTSEDEHAYLYGDRVCNVTGKIFSIDAKKIDPRTFFYEIGLDTFYFFFSIYMNYWRLYGLSDQYEETVEKSMDDYDAELFCVGSDSSSLWDICFTDMGFHTDADDSLPGALMVPFCENEYRTLTREMYSDSETIEIWANCRTDNMIRKEIDLGIYSGGGGSAEVLKDPEPYSYFTFEVKGKKEEGQ